MADVNSRIAAVRQVFTEQFGGDAELVVRAPGRVEIIGGHTDYNQGFVMPAAIDLEVLIAGRKRDERVVDAFSVNFDQRSTFSIDEIAASKDASWSNYIRGVLVQLGSAGVDFGGMELVVEGNIPRGSGLSSSAAIEVATALTTLELHGGEIEPVEIAKLCQRAENEFVGVNSGIMDQFISVGGRAGSAMFLDCRSLEFSYVSLPANTRIVVNDSRKPRTLAGSEYNVRRSQCEEAVAILRGELGDIQALRDVSADDLARLRHLLPEVVRKRATHIVNENARVLGCVDALKLGDAERFGRMLNESHASARDLYEISIPEMDLLQEAAAEYPGCLGSRIMGGGFGGATVSIVNEDRVEGFCASVRQRYLSATGIEPDIMALTASDGASVVG